MVSPWSNKNRSLRTASVEYNCLILHMLVLAFDWTIWIDETKVHYLQKEKHLMETYFHWICICLFIYLSSFLKQICLKSLVCTGDKIAQEMASSNTLLLLLVVPCDVSCLSVQAKPKSSGALSSPILTKWLLWKTKYCAVATAKCFPSGSLR